MPAIWECHADAEPHIREGMGCMWVSDWYASLRLDVAAEKYIEMVLPEIWTWLLAKAYELVLAVVSSGEYLYPTAICRSNNNRFCPRLTTFTLK